MTGAAADVQETAREVTEVRQGAEEGCAHTALCPALREWASCTACSSLPLKAAKCAVLASTIAALSPHILLHTCALFISS